MRFSIRDILWLMVVVALGVMWQAERRRAVDSQVSQSQITVRLAAAHEQLADIERDRHRHWERSRRDPNSLLHFQSIADRMKSGATPQELADELIQRIKTSIPQSRSHGSGSNIAPAEQNRH